MLRPGGSHQGPWPLWLHSHSYRTATLIPKIQVYSLDMSSPLESEMSLIFQDLALRSSPPQLAQEIIDEVVDGFSACSDRAAIIPLATVARARRPRSQMNLFRTHNLWISTKTALKKKKKKAGLLAGRLVFLRSAVTASSSQNKQETQGQLSRPLTNVTEL